MLGISFEMVAGRKLQFPSFAYQLNQVVLTSCRFYRPPRKVEQRVQIFGRFTGCTAPSYRPTQNELEAHESMHHSGDSESCAPTVLKPVACVGRMCPF